MERTIIETEEYTIVETDSCSLEEIVEFVVKENYLHHQKSLPENISEEIEELITEEQRLLPSSRFFLARDNDGQLIGCIRLHRWNHISNLPITKFGVRVEESYLKEKYPNIWHVGRFAIKRHLHNETISILKALIFCAIAPIVNTDMSIMLAEIDVRLIRSLRRMDIGLAPIGKSRYYLGSETFPVCSKASELIRFYERQSNSSFMKFYIETMNSFKLF